MCKGCVALVPCRREYESGDFIRCKRMRAPFHGLCFDCYYIVLFYVLPSLKSLSGTSTCLSVITVNFCLATFFVILEEIRQAVSGSIPLCIFIGSVPELWIPKEKLFKRRGMARATSLHCSLAHSQPAAPAEGGVYTLRHRRLWGDTLL